MIGPLDSSTGLQTTIGFRTSRVGNPVADHLRLSSIQSGKCMAKIRLLTPTCGAARPMPLRSSIVSNKDAANSSSFGPNSLSSTAPHNVLRTGSSQYRIFRFSTIFLPCLHDYGRRHHDGLLPVDRLVQQHDVKVDDVLHRLAEDSPEAIDFGANVEVHAVVNLELSLRHYALFIRSTSISLMALSTCSSVRTKSLSIGRFDTILNLKS